MTATRPLAARVFNRGRSLAAAPWKTRASATTAWNTDRVHPVEVVAPDRESMSWLLEEAAGSSLPAELVTTDSSWIVRLHPPAGGAWVLDFLVLVERWLESCRLPSVTVHYGERSYVIRPTRELARFGAGSVDG
jgi:hypothetical protein